VFPVSAEQGIGVGDLLDAVLELLNTGDVTSPEDTVEKRELRLAIVGRPNVGKSSLLNRILGEDRVIVSPVAGTTRDAIDTVLQTPERKFRLIDTAGIRRKGKTDEMAEKLSVIMARKSLERADVAIVLVDAVEGVTALDANIAVTRSKQAVRSSLPSTSGMRCRIRRQTLQMNLSAGCATR